MVDPLPGGIDDSGSYVYNRLKHKSDADLMGEAAAIQAELEKRQAAAEEQALKDRFPLKAKFYAHSDKESNWSQARELKLSEEASRNFAYTGLEVTIDIIVDEKGGVKATHLNGTALTEPVEI